MESVANMRPPATVLRLRCMEFGNEAARLGPARDAATRERLLKGDLSSHPLGEAGKESLRLVGRLAMRWTSSKLAPGATMPQRAR